jgi:hypothetical protein
MDLAQRTEELELTLPGFFYKNEFHLEHGQGELEFPSRENRNGSIKLGGWVPGTKPEPVLFDIHVPPKKYLGITFKRGFRLHGECDIATFTLKVQLYLFSLLGGRHLYFNKQGRITKAF